MYGIEKIYYHPDDAPAKPQATRTEHQDELLWRMQRDGLSAEEASRIHSEELPANADLENRL